MEEQHDLRVDEANFACSSMMYQGEHALSICICLTACLSASFGVRLSCCTIHLKFKLAILSLRKLEAKSVKRLQPRLFASLFC